MEWQPIESELKPTEQELRIAAAVMARFTGEADASPYSVGGRLILEGLEMYRAENLPPPPSEAI